jgi:hypothetical protein
MKLKLGSKLTFVESYYHKIKGFYVIFKVLMIRAAKKTSFLKLIGISVSLYYDQKVLLCFTK